MTCPLYRFRKLTISLILFPALKTMQKLRMRKRMNLLTTLKRLRTLLSRLRINFVDDAEELSEVKNPYF